MKEKDIIPNQRIGNQLDVSHRVEGKTPEEARMIFDAAVARLLDVNNWERICGPLSAKFTLTNDEGTDVSDKVVPGYYFRIDIPGPGPSAGEGFDWVKVEELEDRRNPADADETVTIRVRPSASPRTDEKDTAHFFDASASSTFRVKREGRTVTAEVHGRNEVPNTHVDRPTDKVRNAVVGAGAVAGVAKPQWASLVKGLLEPPDKKS
jgi:hypothetical protein